MSRRWAITLTTLLVCALTACNRPAPPPKSASGSSKAKTDQAADGPERGPWPFLAADKAIGATREFDPHAVMQRNYYVVFDASGSMSESRCAGNSRKIDVAKRALLAFARQMPSDANLGLLVFNASGIRELIEIGPNNPETLANAINRVQPGGETPLAGAIRYAYRALSKRGAEQLGYGEYHLVVVTDGEATGEDPRGIVDRLITESPVVLHTIGFCIGADHSLNQAGRTVYQSADNPQALEQGLSDVLAEAPSFDVKKFK
jgi:hypothetical protein